MNFIIVPSRTRSSRSTCITLRQLATMAVAGLVVLPLVVGYVVNDIYTRVHPSPALEAHVLAAQQAELTAQRAAIAATRRQAETHLNALAQRLGQLQAQMWRVNALGGQLVAMAGLDKAEFDFSAEPAMGGPETPVGASAPALFPALEALDAQLTAQRERLTALETLLMNRQLEAAVTPAGWPVNGGWVSSGFGWRADPFTGRRARHEGVDIASRLGSPVHAMGDGVVRYAGPKAGYGLMVEITHGDIVTRYAHTKSVLVKVGDRITRGAPIATVGTSGRSTGPHLHFEVLRREHPVNPRPFLQAR
ncbi:MAG: M23 family metallopeptidase [Acidiferrobacterales bacterium]|nr:M23 family metallopeptidase [Acidiferrobacterales bacterium]